jgi:hypothetical protein
MQACKIHLVAGSTEALYMAVDVFLSERKGAVIL